MPRNLLIMLLLLMTTASAADLRAGTVDCEPQKPRGAKVYWSYRIVDGRTCWYAGRPGKSKSQLRWVHAVPSVVERPRTTGTPPSDPGASSLADTCCWPPLEPEPPSPAEPSFKQRWNDLLNDLAEPVTRWRGQLKDQHRFGE